MFQFIRISTTHLALSTDSRCHTLNPSTLMDRLVNVLRKSVCFALAAVLVLSSVTRLAANVLNFDPPTLDYATMNVPPNGAVIPAGYGEPDWTWQNIFVLDPVIGGGGPGAFNGRVSQPQVAYNGQGNPGSVTASTTAFEFVGAYFTAQWNTGLQLDITGLDSGNIPIYSTTLTLNTFGPTGTSGLPTDAFGFTTFNWPNIYGLTFDSHGGTPHPSGDKPHFVMDDFTYNPVPEPSSRVLMGLGTVMVVGLARKWRRRAGKAGDIRGPAIRANTLAKALVAFVIVGLALLPQVCGAATIPGLYPTGVNNSYALLTPSAVDPHYTVLENGNSPAIVYQNAAAFPGWVANGPSSLWVWQTANGTPIGVTRTFHTTFDLTGLDETTATISGQWTGDNDGLRIDINGTNTFNTPFSSGFASFHPFSITSGFQPGMNTIDFVVQDFGGIAGFRVDSISGTAVPEPSTYVLLASAGIGGLFFLRRVRRGKGKAATATGTRTMPARQLRGGVVAGLFGAAIVGWQATASAQIVPVPSGLSPGDPYRLAFVTHTTRDATDTNILFYNAFVGAAATSSPALAPLGVSWTAIASTSTVDARDNTGTNPNVPDNIPIFNLHDTMIAGDNVDLWDGDLLAALDTTPIDTIYHGPVWTGTTYEGETLPIGGYLGDVLGAGSGRSDMTNSLWIDMNFENLFMQRPLYGLSSVLTVPAVPEPSTLALAGFGAACVALAWLRRQRRRPSGKVRSVATSRLADGVVAVLCCATILPRPRTTSGA